MMKRTLAALFTVFLSMTAAAWEGTPIVPLHVEGRHFCDAAGNRVVLHGFAQTYSPYFNELGTKWNNYDVAACLSYNQGVIARMLQAGWKVNFVRMHMDPYWSNTPGMHPAGEADISAFSFERFARYLDEVFVPMAQYAISKGLYVVMRPPGVCPEQISVGDAYQQYLLRVWEHVAQHPALKDNPGVMFELANEPVRIVRPDGSAAGAGEMTAYIQPVVDAVRRHCRNIVLVPGLGYQSAYADFVTHPVVGENLGYAVHCYPGWYNGAHDQSTEVVVDYERFREGWRKQVGAIANIAPVVVTEMDWAPVKYNASWGKSTTGVPGGTGFGANFKRIADEEGNVSWLIFTWPDILARYDGVAATGETDKTILNDPEACVWPTYHWYEDYARENYPATAPYGRTTARGRVVSLAADRSLYTVMPGATRLWTVTATYENGDRDNVTAMVDTETNSEAIALWRGAVVGRADGRATVTCRYANVDGSEASTAFDVEVSTFPLTADGFDPSIWEKGTFDSATGELHTGQWGFGGWRYDQGVDLSAYKYLVVELCEPQTCGASFRLFDEKSYWSKPAMYSFGSGTRIVVDLHNMKKDGSEAVCDPSHIYIAGFWTTGSGGVRIKSIYLSNDGVTSTALREVVRAGAPASEAVYNLAGQMVARDGLTPSLPGGTYIYKGKIVKMK